MSIEFVHPQAASCIPTKEGVKLDPLTEPFEYVEATMPTKHGFVIRWGMKHFGFGEITFGPVDGKWSFESECMSDDFVVRVLTEWVKRMDEENAK